jgi:hypothetical protein
VQKTAQHAEDLACTAEAAHLQKNYRVLAQKKEKDVVLHFPASI